MAESPNVSGSGVVRLTLESDGSPVDETVRVYSVSVHKRINMIPIAQIVLEDGDMAEQDFPLSNSDTFKPGTEIRILAGYDQDEEAIFEGIVVKHGVRVGAKNVSQLVVECRDKAVAMTLGRRNRNHLESTDSDIISTLVGEYGSLTADVKATPTTFPELVQYYCTDWDFLLARAEVNSLLVIADAGTVSVKAPDVGSAVLSVAYGQDLYSFEAEMDARTQRDAVTGTSWDPANQELVTNTANPETVGKQGDLTAAKLAEGVGSPQGRLQTPAPLDKPSIDAWTKARQTKAALARIRGRMAFQGSAKAALGKTIEVAGVGNRFAGEVLVSSVLHEIAAGNWTTEVEFGMSPDWFTERKDVVAPLASGWTAGIDGLHIGVVTKLDAHPGGEPMVQVKVPVLEAESEGVWARLTKFYASDKIGAFFIPEIGDEVILGFLNGDPSFPVILGSVYSSKRPPPYELTAENHTKAIVTRSEMRIEFDDEKQIITVTTPAENTIVISDDAESILLTDQNGNKAELAPSGITLESPKDITITAKGKIAVDAVGEITVTSQADVSTSGLNVNNEAKVGFVAKGNASAELSASGQTTVKGAMVMIN